MTDPATATPAAPSGRPSSLTELLGPTATRPWWRRGSTLALAAVAIAGALAWWLWPEGDSANALVHYTTEPLQRGSISLSVNANGTLQPTRSVNIGSELSGTVINVHVDVNDRVKKGQVLVELDTAKLGDQITRSRAALASAQAKLAVAAATAKEAAGNLGRQEEVARLSNGRVPSQAELATARAAVERAQAEQNAAQANVAEAKAGLSTDETNLAKASIRSPIDGVVLSRSVEPGNAVAASLQAVTLFSIAEDLTQLKLNVNVDEADVGAVAVGQAAGFTVAAHAGRRFPAKITRVAYGSTTTDNVVTYTTVMDVANTDLSLRPGMTATATIVATERRDVLLVPTSALRFTPAAAANAAGSASSSASSPSVLSRLMPRAPGLGGSRRPTNPADPTAPRRIWVLKDGAPSPLMVKVGISDGKRTEVSADGLHVGLPVITDQRGGTSK